MIEKWRESIDQSESFGALLTDLSKVFDYLAHDLMMVKVDAYGLEMPSLRSMYYLSNRKQRVKANDACNFWSNILFGVPLGLILVLCYLYFHLRTIFFVSDSNIVNYADDNTPYSAKKKLKNVLNNPGKEFDILLQW